MTQNELYFKLNSARNWREYSAFFREFYDCADDHKKIPMFLYWQRDKSKFSFKVKKFNDIVCKKCKAGRFIKMDKEENYELDSYKRKVAAIR